MINVNEITKNAYKSDSVEKNWTINFPELSLTFADEIIIQESAELFESVLEDTNLQFVGCISSRFSVILRMSEDTAKDLKNAYMTVTVSTPSIQGSEPVVVFTGYVDSVEIESNKRNKKITAYDPLYSLSQVNVANWYKTLPYPVSLKDFRDSLFEYLNVSQQTTSLPIDDLEITRQFDPQKLSALDVIKQLCQINGVFGKMGRDGTFQYLTPNNAGSETLEYCRSADYQEYTVQKITRVTVRYGDVWATYLGDIGKNEYVVQNNMFMANMSDETLFSAARSIFSNIQNFVYTPFNAEINGLPYLECLDTVTMPILNVETDEWETKTFTVISRTTTGMEAMKDSVSASGDETVHLFVSDLGIDLDQLEKVVEQIQEDLDNLKFRYYLITNNADINIHDGDITKVIDLRFSATGAVTTIFQAEILCDIDTTVDGITYGDTKVKAIYEINEVELADYYPTQTWDDGDHIFHLYKNITIAKDNLMMHLEVYLQADGGDVYIANGHLRASLYGQNLVASDEWDGILELEEQISPITLNEIAMVTAADSIETDTQIPETSQPTDTASIISFYEISMANALDHCNVNFIGNLKRITENGDTRITETDDVRYTEGE